METACHEIRARGQLTKEGPREVRLREERLRKEPPGVCRRLA
jgi:hypothetical protein